MEENESNYELHTFKHFYLAGRIVIGYKITAINGGLRNSQHFQKNQMHQAEVALKITVLLLLLTINVDFCTSWSIKFGF